MANKGFSNPLASVFKDIETYIGKQSIEWHLASQTIFQFMFKKAVARLQACTAAMLQVLTFEAQKAWMLIQSLVALLEACKAAM